MLEKIFLGCIICGVVLGGMTILVVVYAGLPLIFSVPIILVIVGVIGIYVMDILKGLL